MQDDTIRRLRELENELDHAPGRDTGPLTKEIAEQRAMIIASGQDPDA